MGKVTDIIKTNLKDAQNRLVNAEEKVAAGRAQLKVWEDWAEREQENIDYWSRALEAGGEPDA